MEQLTHRKRVHPIREIAPHQAVTGAAEGIEARASRGEDADIVGVDIEEPLEEVAPLPVPVNFIEGHHGEPCQGVDSGRVPRVAMDLTDTRQPGFRAA